MLAKITQRNETLIIELLIQLNEVKYNQIHKGDRYNVFNLTFFYLAKNIVKYLAYTN